MTDATLIRTGERPVLRFERFLPKPIEEVWRAVSDPAEMRAWFPTRVDLTEWVVGAAFLHHFDEHPQMEPLPGLVLACEPPHRLSFTWGEDTIGFELTETEGGTTFVLTEQLSPQHVARNAAGWEVCLDNLVHGDPGESWKPRFERYVKQFEPEVGPQEGPPAGIG